MTTKPASLLATKRLPDPPEREPDEVTAYDHVYKPGGPYLLTDYFGNPETTLVEADRWMVATPESNMAAARRPDLLIAFNVSRRQYRANNGYIISEQGKPPDFVLEVASISTARTDTGAKRRDYAALGIPEYWRFDETGEYHGERLAGDRLSGGRYEPIALEEPESGILQGYSPALNLILRWNRGRLEWLDPGAGRHIPTLDDERSRAEAERMQAQTERARAEAAQEQVQTERARAEAAQEQAQTERARAEAAQEQAQTERARAEAAQEQVRKLEDELARRDRQE